MASIVYCFHRRICLWFLGEPHIDGEPGDLKFKIKQLKWVLVENMLNDLIVGTLDPFI